MTYEEHLKTGEESLILETEVLFEEYQLQLLLFDNQKWFWLKDICFILGAKNFQQVLNIFDDDELRVIGNITEEQQDDNAVINESGLYRIIFIAKNSIANKLRKWFTYEIKDQISNPNQDFAYYEEQKSITFPDYLKKLAEQVAKNSCDENVGENQNV